MLCYNKKNNKRKESISSRLKSDTVMYKLACIYEERVFSHIADKTTFQFKCKHKILQFFLLLFVFYFTYTSESYCKQANTMSVFLSYTFASSSYTFTILASTTVSLLSAFLLLRMKHQNQQRCNFQ